MSIEKARAFFREHGIEDRVLEFEVSSATVELAAQAVGCEPERIAKTLSFKKDAFGMKATMLPHDDVERLIGHAVGGVCPFGRNAGVPVYIDESVKRFDTVYPAVGSANSAIGLSIDELYALSEAEGWVDVCKLPEAQA